MLKIESLNNKIKILTFGTSLLSLTMAEAGKKCKICGKTDAEQGSSLCRHCTSIKPASPTEKAKTDETLAQRKMEAEAQVKQGEYKRAAIALEKTKMSLEAQGEKLEEQSKKLSDSFGELRAALLLGAKTDRFYAEGKPFYSQEQQMQMFVLAVHISISAFLENIERIREHINSIVKNPCPGGTDQVDIEVAIDQVKDLLKDSLDWLKESQTLSEVIDNTIVICQACIKAMHFPQTISTFFDSLRDNPKKEENLRKKFASMWENRLSKFFAEITINTIQQTFNDSFFQKKMSLAENIKATARKMWQGVVSHENSFQFMFSQVQFSQKGIEPGDFLSPRDVKNILNGLDASFSPQVEELLLTMISTLVRKNYCVLALNKAAVRRQKNGNHPFQPFFKSGKTLYLGSLNEIFTVKDDELLSISLKDGEPFFFNLEPKPWTKCFDPVQQEKSKDLMRISNSVSLVINKDIDTLARASGQDVDDTSIKHYLHEVIGCLDWWFKTNKKEIVWKTEKTSKGTKRIWYVK